ncbi:MAG: DNA-processing protein DprA, partial [Conexivisphaera sp.]
MSAAGMMKVRAADLLGRPLRSNAERAAAPPVLYVEGRAEMVPIPSPRIAVGGTREPTQRGESVAAGIARSLAGAGATVVSGLARGIDAIAHAAAMDAGGARWPCWPL